ncbi:MAG: AbrB/MazE/SpoVT family DNA-binding domain-containing protein [Nocardioidaceae bacterium]|nr:AbrB/MazE/SpoVT family DNA-binding domain-containing protein [Nocardioidaceae bacterium]
MRTTIDKAGRLVIPKELRDRIGLQPGEVDVEVDGAAVRVEPVASDRVEERDGLLLVPSTATKLSDEEVARVRDVDQR